MSVPAGNSFLQHTLDTLFRKILLVILTSLTIQILNEGPAYNSILLRGVEDVSVKSRKNINIPYFI